MDLLPFVFLDFDNALLLLVLFGVLRKLRTAVVLPKHVIKQLITKPFVLMLKANHLEKSANLMNNLGVIPRIALLKLPECRIHTHHCLQVSVLHSLKKDIN